jgi:hypothetical protein
MRKPVTDRRGWLLPAMHMLAARNPHSFAIEEVEPVLAVGHVGRRPRPQERARGRGTVRHSQAVMNGRRRLATMAGRPESRTQHRGTEPALVARH